MHADAEKLLWDASRAAERVARFLAGKAFADYLQGEASSQPAWSLCA
jgi:hypothetical protein